MATAASAAPWATWHAPSGSKALSLNFRPHAIAGSRWIRGVGENSGFGGWTESAFDSDLADWFTWLYAPGDGRDERDLEQLAIARLKAEQR